jgi:membrane protease YdiL (CAAX protease family)
MTVTVTNGVPTQGWRLWTGLGRSPFLGDLRAEDRDPRRLVATLVIGLSVAILASIAGWIVVVAPFAILSGAGDRGLAALGDIGLLMKNPQDQSLAVAVLRLLVATGTDGLTMLVFVAVAAALAGRALKRYATAAPTVRWRLLAAGVVLAIIALVPAVAADRATGGDGASLPLMAVAKGWDGRLIYAAASLLLIPAAFAEELVFRGWLVRQFAALTRRPSLLLLSSGLVFSAIHLDFSPEGFLTRLAMGAGLAYMTLRLGGVELAAGVHAANNIMIVLFVQQLGPLTDSGAADSIVQVLASDLVMLLVYVGLAEAVARIGPLSRLLRVEPRELSPLAAAPAPFS